MTFKCNANVVECSGVEEVKKRYNVPVTVYKPEGCETVEDFERKFGEKFWETDEDAYDFAVKVCVVDCSAYTTFILMHYLLRLKPLGERTRN